MKYIVTLERVDYFDVEVIDAADADEAVKLAHEIICAAPEADQFLVSSGGFEAINTEAQQKEIAA